MAGDHVRRDSGRYVGYGKLTQHLTVACGSSVDVKDTWKGLDDTPSQNAATEHKADRVIRLEVAK